MAADTQQSTPKPRSRKKTTTSRSKGKKSAKARVPATRSGTGEHGEGDTPDRQDHELKLKYYSIVYIPLGVIVAGIITAIIGRWNGTPSCNINLTNSTEGGSDLLSVTVDRTASGLYQLGVDRKSSNARATLALYRRAESLRPKNDVYIQAVGALLVNLGEYQAGESQLRRAISIEVNNAKARYNLVLALAYQRRCKEAHEALGQASLLRPDYSQRGGVERILSGKCPTP